LSMGLPSKKFRFLAHFNLFSTSISRKPNEQT
jgi:hypothetical protein